MQITRLRTRLGAVVDVPIVLTGVDIADVIDDKLVDTVADFVKRNAIMASQIEV